MTQPYEPVVPILAAGEKGLTKREYFAALAMTAAYGTRGVSAHDAENYAKSCGAYADALIAELSKEDKPS